MFQSNYIIPLHKPFWGRDEEKAAITAMRGGTGIGDLNYSELLSKELAQLIGVKFALPTSSGTASLELACAYLLKKDDEVILPSFTFSSCANAVLLAGGKPIFADIDIQTYNIDPLELEKLITKKTKAIMVVHYAGMAADMEAINKIAEAHKLMIIEDATHALGAKYQGRYLGTIGAIGCYSFRGTKNAISGEGGAFITSDPKINKIAEIIREKGTNRSSFMRGERRKYSWVRVGRSLVLSDILSAIALVQIRKLNQITTLRQKKAEYLLKKLESLSSKIILPIVSKGTDPNWHIFAIRVPRSSRNHIIKELKSYGIEASFHYLPLHTSIMGRSPGYKSGNLPVTEEVSSTLIRLPIYPQLKNSEMDYMVDVLKKIL